MATPEYPNYTPEHPTISGDFNKRYDRNGFGIGNIEANISDKARRATERTIQYAGQGTARVGKRLKEQALQRESRGQSGVATASMKRAGDTLNKTGRVVNAASRGFAFRRGNVGLSSARFQIGMTMGWTGLLNVISFWAGILTLVALGATTMVTAIPFGEEVADIVAFWFGFSNFDIWILAVACFALHIFLVVTIYAVSYLQLKLGGLQPIHGTASGMKTLALIGSFVISAIPGANFIPWVWVWLFVVGVFPN